MKYIYIFIGIIILKFLLNLIKYINGFILENIWFSFFSKNNTNAISYTRDIQKYFKDANVKTHSFCGVEPIGYGKLATTSYDYYDNIFINSKQTASWVSQTFLEARGVYRRRMWQSFNPFYWIELIIKLPRHIIEYLGLDTETVFTKIFQLVYWIIDSILLVYYREPIFDFFQKFFTELFK